MNTRAALLVALAFTASFLALSACSSSDDVLPPLPGAGASSGGAAGRGGGAGQGGVGTAGGGGAAAGSSGAPEAGDGPAGAGN